MWKHPEVSEPIRDARALRKVSLILPVLAALGFTFAGFLHSEGADTAALVTVAPSLVALVVSPFLYMSAKKKESESFAAHDARIKGLPQPKP